MKDTQKILKEDYKNTMEQVYHDKKMVDYCTKKVDYIVKLLGGEMIAIDKFSIEKDFYFGIGLNGIWSKADKIVAHHNMYAAKNDQNYFMEKNLEQVDRFIYDLKDCIGGSDQCVIYSAYRSLPDTSPLKQFQIVHYWKTPEYAPAAWANYGTVRKLSDEEIVCLIEGYQEVRKHFEKRIKTYLKRYGLSKVSAQSYLVD